MSDAPAPRHRRPPPPPPALPRRVPRPTAEVVAPAPPVRRGGPAPLNVQPGREWRPLPWPGTIPLGPPLPPPPGAEREHESLIDRRMAWTAMLSWTFGVVVLLLVVMPTTALPKLTGPMKTPVSAAGYGPLVAVFGILAVAIAVGAGLWIWVAMSRDHDAATDDPGQLPT